MTYPVRYGGDSGNRIFVLYWRCPLLEVPLYNICMSASIWALNRDDDRTIAMIRF